jgi:hypothetical protein
VPRSNEGRKKYAIAVVDVSSSGKVYEDVQQITGMANTVTTITEALTEGAEGVIFLNNR